METADCGYAIKMGGECEILILPSPSPPINVLTHALSHMLPPQTLNGMGRVRPAASGEMCLFRGHYAITLCSLCGSHTVPPIADGEKEKWTLLPIGSLAYVPAPMGASLSFLLPLLLFPAAIRVINSPKKKQNHLSLACG